MLCPSRDRLLYDKTQECKINEMKSFEQRFMNTKIAISKLKNEFLLQVNCRFQVMFPGGLRANFSKLKSFSLEYVAQ